MSRLADTLAAELAQTVWYGIDAPAAEPTVAALRVALRAGLPGDVSVEDVYEYVQPALAALQSAPSMLSYEARLVGAITAAMVFGAKLQETNGS